MWDEKGDLDSGICDTVFLIGRGKEYSKAGRGPALTQWNGETCQRQRLEMRCQEMGLFSEISSFYEK
jgi:hypothetical protein